MVRKMLKKELERTIIKKEREKKRKQKEEGNPMEKTTLLVLAAGMGSRYGGLKQIDPLGPNGEIIIDYSLHDAWLAGFRRVVFVIKEELLDTFEEKVEIGRAHV